MMQKNQDEIISGLINGIAQKNILIVHQEDAHMPEMMYCLISRIIDIHTIPLIWICWNEPANTVKKRLGFSGYCGGAINIIDTVSNTTEDNSTPIHSQKNYTGILMEMQRLTTNKEHILVLDNLNILGVTDNERAFIRFLSFLLRKSKDSGGTTFASLSAKLLRPDIEKLLFSLYDTIFYLNDDRIWIKGSRGKGDISYEIKNNKLLLKRSLTSDIIKIKDIFDISSEETGHLDKIVEKQMNKYKEILV